MSLWKTVTTICAVLVISACATLGASIEAPKVKLTSIEMMPGSGFEQRFLLGLRIANPNEVPLPLQGMSFTLALNGVDLIDGVSGNLPVIEPYSEALIEVEAGADLLSAVRLVRKLMGQSELTQVDYGLEANLDLKGFPRSFKVSQQGQVPLRAE